MNALCANHLPSWASGRGPLSVPVPSTPEFLLEHPPGHLLGNAGPVFVTACLSSLKPQQILEQNSPYIGGSRTDLSEDEGSVRRRHRANAWWLPSVRSALEVESTAPGPGDPHPGLSAEFVSCLHRQGSLRRFDLLKFEVSVSVTHIYWPYLKAERLTIGFLGCIKMSLLCQKDCVSEPRPLCSNGVRLMVHNLFKHSSVVKNLDFCAQALSLFFSHCSIIHCELHLPKDDLQYSIREVSCAIYSMPVSTKKKKKT
ncbi:LOW QUALITY PROTEIN: hypothetical protein AAY473_036961 [Plecturocebus cupreus]